MKGIPATKFYLLIAICFAIGILQWSFKFSQRPSVYRSDKLEDYLQKQAEQFGLELSKLKQLVNEKGGSRQALITQFLTCRQAYKKIEGFTGYFFAYSERDLNGPPIPVVEEEEQSKYIRPPHGLQVIEEKLFEKKIDRIALLAEIDFTLKITRSLALSFKTLNPYEYQLFDVLQLRLVKLYALGINNFDCQETKSGIGETNIALTSMKEIMLTAYSGMVPAFESVFSRLDSASLFLSNSERNLRLKKTNIDFDYYGFYRNYILPLNKELVRCRKAIVRANPNSIRALNLSASSIFETEAYNTYYFTKMQKANTNKHLSALGKTLFFDPVLSRDNAVSCASCHRPELAFTDGLAKAKGFLMNDTLPRNTPTLLNAALQKNLFLDARVLVLEDQAKSVVQNEREMHGDFGEVVMKLKQSSEYKQLFALAFNETKDAEITEHGILTALAEFQRTLLSFNSRFDQSIRGEKNDLSDDEITGYNLFMGKAKCAHCHFTGLFNGTAPPLFDESEFDVIGVPYRNKKPYQLDGDVGRYGVFNNDELKFAFKTPTVRNVSVTAPYMHNGVFETLKEVVEFYNKGGGIGLGIKLPTQTLPAAKLNLTETEKKQLIRFMESLTDTSSVVYFNQALPKMDDPDSPLNVRKASVY
jgi:cytochrome c peroxidase